jgi:hypothetical protein
VSNNSSDLIDVKMESIHDDNDAMTSDLCSEDSWIDLDSKLSPPQNASDNLQPNLQASDSDCL